MAAAASAREGASEAMVTTSESTDSEMGDVAASLRRVVPFKSSVWGAPHSLYMNVLKSGVVF